MTSNRKLSTQFRQLLPVIYPKLIRDGYKHKDCAKWLRDNHNLNISAGLFTTYLNRYGNLKEEEEKYLRHLERNSSAWWKSGEVKDLQTPPDGEEESKEGFVKPNDVSKKEDSPTSSVSANSSKQHTSGITSVTHYSSALDLGRAPSDNKYRDMENPLDKIKKNKLRRTTKKQTNKK